MRYSKFDLLAIALIVVYNLAIYSNSLNLKFTFDDYSVIVQNAGVNPKNPISDIFKHDFWGLNITTELSHKSFRPLTTYSFRLNRQLAQNETEAEEKECPVRLARSYHIVNLATQVIVAIVLYFFVLMIARLGLPQNATNETETEDCWCKILAFFSTIYFSSLPAHVEAVTGLVGRADLYCAVFSMIGTMLYAKSCDYDLTWEEAKELDDPVTQNEPTFQIPLKSWIFVVLATLFAFLSSMSKELGFATLGVYLIYELLLGSPTTDSSYYTHMMKRRRTAMITRLAIVFLSLIAFLIFRTFITVNLSAPIFRRAENPVVYEKGINWLLSCFVIHVKYFVQLILPFNLSADYSFNQIPMVRSIFEFRNLYSFCMYGLLFFFGVKLLWQAGNLYARKLIFLLGWTLGFFFPASHLVFYVGTTVAERLLYVPSVCSSILIVILFLKPFHSFDNVRFPSERSEKRIAEINENEKDISSADVRENAISETEEKETDEYSQELINRENFRPTEHKEKSRITEVKEQSNEKKHEESSSETDGEEDTIKFANVGKWAIGLLFFAYLIYFTKMTYENNPHWDGWDIFFHSAKVCPNSSKNHFFVGNFRLERNEWNEAIAEFKRVIEIEPDFCDVYYAWGVAEFNRGNRIVGRDILFKALGCWRVASDAYAALASFYNSMKFEDESTFLSAIRWPEMLRKANHTNHSAYAYFELASFFFERNETESSKIKRNHAIALSLAEKSAEIAHSNCTTRFATANLLFQHNYTMEAASHLELLADSYKCPDHFSKMLEYLVTIYGNALIENQNDVTLRHKYDRTLMRAQFFFSKYGMKIVKEYRNENTVPSLKPPEHQELKNSHPVLKNAY